MITKINIFLIFALFLSANLSFSQTSDTVRTQRLMVLGKNIAFSIQEPVGWIGDTETAKDYYSHVVFYKSKEDVKIGGALVQVFSFEKTDENTNEDLNSDILSYKEPDLKQEDFSVSHKEYECFSKLVYVDDQFYQYLVYVNPGPKYKHAASIVLNISKLRASEEDLAAFREIIASLIMLK